MSNLLDEISMAYDDITLVPAYSELKSRSEADPSIHGYKIPIIASCMDTLSNPKMLELFMEKNIPFIIHRAFKSAQEQFSHFIPTIDNSKNYNCVWFAVGSVQKYKDWIDFLFENGVRRFCVDMAHGDSKTCIDTIKYIKNKINTSTINSILNQTPHIIAGNVASGEGFRRLEEAGADGIRVGVASGQICSTALNTAMGVPILTSIQWAVKYRKNKNTWIIADGGVKYTGDITKAVWAGADFCMIGKMLASTDLATGKCYNKKLEMISDDEVIYPHQISDITTKIEKQHISRAEKIRKLNEIDNKLIAFKTYHGMASRSARSGLLSYAAVEGVDGLTKYISTTEQYLQDTYLRLQASLSYGGVSNWNDFRKIVKAIRRSNAGIIAAETHLEVTTDR